MNDNFKRAVERSGKSQYQIASESGIPFSTVNAIMNEKQSVNRCAAATLLRIATVLGENYAKLLDNYPLLDNTTGTYKGIKYKWINKEQGMMISFVYEKENIEIDTYMKLDIPDKQEDYHYIAEWKIDEYLRLNEFKKRLEAIGNE